MFRTNSPLVRPRALRVETLEPRMLMAADLAAMPTSQPPASPPTLRAVAEEVSLPAPLPTLASEPAAHAPVVRSVSDVFVADPAPKLWETAPVDRSSLPVYTPAGSLPSASAKPLLSIDATVQRATVPIARELPTAIDPPIISASLRGDFDGDGVQEVGLFVAGVWWLDVDHDGVRSSRDIEARLGQAGDAPLVGDWDGDGRDELAVVKPTGAVEMAELDLLEYHRIDASHGDTPRPTNAVVSAFTQYADLPHGLRHAFESQHSGEPMKYAAELAARSAELR